MVLVCSTLECLHLVKFKFFFFTNYKYINLRCKHNDSIKFETLI